MSGGPAPAAKKKAALRAALRQQAAALPANQVAASDAAITRQVLALPEWQRAGTVFLYVSVGREPDTRRLLDEALLAGKRVCVPRCQGGGVMQAVPIASMACLAPAAYGLLEPPASAPALAPDQIDLVLAPCVAADAAGYRLGNGGGYYDRYLPGVGGPVLCLCRQALLQPALPREGFDHPVNGVVLEQQVLRFARAGMGKVPKSGQSG